MRCSSCSEVYAVEREVPILLGDRSRTAYKEQQARSHDKAGSPAEAVFETTRPVGSPAFYGWLLGHKQELSLGSPVSVGPGDVAVVSCGGSGMDAHFLASRGARVISVDISLGAALRTRARAARYGLEVISVVGDAERLPIGDRVAQIGYVHDGLHHLESPAQAISELARVSSRDLSITEPAKALATAVAVRLGASEAVEESGNSVYRFTVEELERQLRDEGFTDVSSRRYAMWYRHTPAPLVRLLSRGRLRRAGIAGFEVADQIVGAHGNKVTARARRPVAGAAALRGGCRTSPGDR
jgi:SAM-dependent methyltransferase